MMGALAAPSFRATMGAAGADISPPVGVHNRCWGAAAQAVSAGNHLGLRASVLVVAGGPGQAPRAILAIDGSWWQGLAAERRLRSAIAAAIGADPDDVLTCLSHSHASVPLLDSYAGLPGGEAAERWFAEVVETCAALARRALDGARPATMEWAVGHCRLARNRDQLADGQWLVGHEPSVPADDALLAGRVVADDGALVATLVNYACHPTTLGWGNRLVSPDWPGAMRQVVEAAHPAPCLFLQGAGGDLAPAEQYADDPALAERHGRMVGHAACAALAGLGAPGTGLAFAGQHASGAALGLWTRQAVAVDHRAAGKRLDLQVPLRDSLETLAQLDAALASEADAALAERLRRRRRVRLMVGDGTTATLPIWCWRLGKVLFVGVPGEPYSALQLAVRAAFPDHAVVLINHANGGSGYLIPASWYGRPGFYPAWQTPFAAGSFECLVDAILPCLHTLTASAPEAP
jgi:hypothetical protein